MRVWGGVAGFAVESDGVCSLIVLLCDECVCEANRVERKKRLCHEANTFFILVTIDILF